MVIIAVLFISLCAFASFIMLLLKWVGVIALPWWQIAAPVWGGYLILIIITGVIMLRIRLQQYTDDKRLRRGRK